MINFSAVPRTSFIGRITRYPLRLLPSGATVPILQGPARGKRWIVGSQRHAFWLGSYEPHMQKLIASKIKPGGVFYDVGANVGFYSLLASSLIVPGKVFAFEPLTTNVDFLRRHLALNRVTNVEVLEVAICDQVGTSLFYVEETGAMGSLQPNGTFVVKTTTLDALIQEQKIAPPNYIKMDIEGAEVKALEGARLTFEKHQPLLFLATHGRTIHETCCNFLQSLQYDVRVIERTSQDRAESLASPVRSGYKAPLSLVL